MFVRSHREPHATFASRIRVTIADENSPGAKLADEFRIRRADAYEYKVGTARPILKTKGSEFLLQNLTASLHLSPVAFHVFLIL